MGMEMGVGIETVMTMLTETENGHGNGDRDGDENRDGDGDKDGDPSLGGAWTMPMKGSKVVSQPAFPAQQLHSWKNADMASPQITASAPWVILLSTGKRMG